MTDAPAALNDWIGGDARPKNPAIALRGLMFGLVLALALWAMIITALLGLF